MKSTKTLRVVMNEQMLFAESNNLEFLNVAWAVTENEIVSKVWVNETEVKYLTTFVKSLNPLKLIHSIEDN